jgi:hypothetical protein
MGSFMGKTKIYYEFKRKNVNCYSCPAYRATLLYFYIDMHAGNGQLVSLTKHT